MKQQECNPAPGVSRRNFIGGAAGTGLLLALTPELISQERKPRLFTKRTWFVNLSHEHYSGHEYYILMGNSRHRLRELTPGDPALQRARRGNSFLRQVPDASLTHVVEVLQAPAAEVVLSYLIKDANTASGEWQMSAIFLTPPLPAFRYAYQLAQSGVELGSSLPLSAKRRKYKLSPAVSLEDLMGEEALLDATDWATAMVNLHPELLSADPGSAAHIQTTHIRKLPATFELSEVLSEAGPASPQQGGMTDNPTGWATLVPYLDKDGAPLVNTKGKNAGLILYDPRWQPRIAKPFVAAAMKPALRTAKNDTTLGVDVTRSPTTVPSGSIWTRNDATTSLTQTEDSKPRPDPADSAQFVLTNVTPKFGGYSCSATTAVAGSDAVVTLQFKNWYVRFMALYLQFLTSDGQVVPIASLPSGIAPEDPLITENNELLIGPLNPEFTIYGIPVQSSGYTFTFNFPVGLATSARILASGLGAGSHTASDTEAIGIVMTTLFNLIIPAGLIALAIGTSIDVYVKTVAIPFALLVAREDALIFTGGNLSQVGTVFWRALVRGAAGPALKLFLESFTKFLAYNEVIDGIEDAIPIAGQIIAALGVLGTLAEIAETTSEAGTSPWTYIYNMVGTHDLSLSILPDPREPNGFPAAAATYKVTAIFDKGVPQVISLKMPGAGTRTLPPVLFSEVPLGGNVTLTVGFYSADNTQVGHGTTGAIPNVLTSSPSITITETRLPIGPSTIYQHKQKTTLDAQGKHLWICAPAPPPPTAVNACATAPGQICEYRSISYNSTFGNVGYAWQSFSESACDKGGAGQLDQLASIENVNDGPDAQGSYAALPCSLTGRSRMIYDPLGRPNYNFYIDSTDNLNLLRKVSLDPTLFADPHGNLAWGKFTLPVDDMLVHPSGAVVTINQALSRMESLIIPAVPMTDAKAEVSLLADLHGGLGSRPGLFNNPTVATITAEGVVLVVEAGNNRIHAVDVSGNPVRHFTRQAEPYFLSLAATGGSSTEYLDVAVEFTGLIYLLSVNKAVYRLDIYDPELEGTSPLSTTMGFNAARVAVDYWRNVYSLNYEVLQFKGALPASGVTEPSISEWIATTPPACQIGHPRETEAVLSSPKRLLRRRDLLRLVARS